MRRSFAFSAMMRRRHRLPAAVRTRGSVLPVRPTRTAATMRSQSAASFSTLLPPPPAPPAPPCDKLLEKKCPLPFPSLDECLACTRNVPDVGASCKPKDRHAYCNGTRTMAL